MDRAEFTLHFNPSENGSMMDRAEFTLHFNPSENGSMMDRAEFTLHFNPSENHPSRFCMCLFWQKRFLSPSFTVIIMTAFDIGMLFIPALAKNRSVVLACFSSRLQTIGQRCGNHVCI
jgi:hypothetical protein